MGKLSSHNLLLLFMMMMMVVVEPYDKSIKVEALLSSEKGGEYLNVATPVFANNLKTTIDGVVQVASLVAKIGGGFGGFRVSNALSDCLDLLQLSSDELNWSLYASQHGHGKGNGTGDLASDLKTWLSAALVNQETCLEGFDGSGTVVESLVSGSVSPISSLIREVLHMVLSVQGSKSGHVTGTRPSVGGRRLMTKGVTFPHWIKLKDRKLLQAGEISPNVVVAQDGSGNFTSIMDAIEATPSDSIDRFVIYVKEGVYDENVEIKKMKTNIMMYGDGMDVTVITGDRNVIDVWTTYSSATFAVTGAGFIARDMTFQNTAGPEKHQAVAFRSDSDLSALYRCAFRGYQDTLYTHANRQFFRECTITGTVDFIFGDGVVVFQSCQIQSRQGLPNQKNTITAQDRTDPGENTGFSIQFCNITDDSSLTVNNTSSNATNSTNTYLGRPWKTYSRTIIMESYISDVVRPKGWLEWNGNVSLDYTLYYGEYMNYGPGASLGSRLKWAGYHIFNSSAQVVNYTVAQFINGDLWLPTTGVRFASGLSA